MDIYISLQISIAITFSPCKTLKLFENIDFAVLGKPRQVKLEPLRADYL